MASLAWTRIIPRSASGLRRRLRQGAGGKDFASEAFHLSWIASTASAAAQDDFFWSSSVKSSLPNRRFGRRNQLQAFDLLFRNFLCLASFGSGYRFLFHNCGQRQWLPRRPGQFPGRSGCSTGIAAPTSASATGAERPMPPLPVRYTLPATRPAARCNRSKTSGWRLVNRSSRGFFHVNPCGFFHNRRTPKRSACRPRNFCSLSAAEG